VEEIDDRERGEILSKAVATKRGGKRAKLPVLRGMAGKNSHKFSE